MARPVKKPTFLDPYPFSWTSLDGVRCKHGTMPFLSLTHLHDLLAAAAISPSAPTPLTILLKSCNLHVRRSRTSTEQRKGMSGQLASTGATSALECSLPSPPALNQPDPVTKIENHSRGPVRFVPAATENTRSNVEAPLGPVRAAPPPPTNSNRDLPRPPNRDAGSDALHIPDAGWVLAAEGDGERDGVGGQSCLLCLSADLSCL